MAKFDLYKKIINSGDLPMKLTTLAATISLALFSLSSQAEHYQYNYNTQLLTGTGVVCDPDCASQPFITSVGLSVILDGTGAIVGNQFYLDNGVLKFSFIDGVPIIGTITRNNVIDVLAWSLQYEYDSGVFLNSTTTGDSVSGGPWGFYQSISAQSAAPGTWNRDEKSLEYTLGLSSTIPEPNSYALMLAGLGLIGYRVVSRKS